MQKSFCAVRSLDSGLRPALEMTMRDVISTGRPEGNALVISTGAQRSGEIFCAARSLDSGSNEPALEMTIRDVISTGA